MNHDATALYQVPINYFPYPIRNDKGRRTTAAVTEEDNTVVKLKGAGGSLWHLSGAFHLLRCIFKSFFQRINIL